MSQSSTPLDTQVEGLRLQVQSLSERLARLEGASGTSLKPSEVDALPHGEPIAEETLLLISAAVGAFLGERVHLRQIRLITSRAWAAQGRVSIQASHHLANTR